MRPRILSAPDQRLAKRGGSFCLAGDEEEDRSEDEDEEEDEGDEVAQQGAREKGKRQEKASMKRRASHSQETRRPHGCSVNILWSGQKQT